MAVRVTLVTGVSRQELFVVIGRLALANVLERPAKLVPSAVDVGLYSPQWEIEGRRDFLVRPPLHVAEHDTGAILRPQAGNGSLDRRAQLAGFQLVERRFLLHRHVE